MRLTPTLLLLACLPLLAPAIHALPQDAGDEPVPETPEPVEGQEPAAEPDVEPAAEPDAEPAAEPVVDPEEAQEATPDVPLAPSEAPELLALVELSRQRREEEDRLDPMTYHSRWRDALEQARRWAAVSADSERNPLLSAEYEWLARFCEAELSLAEVGTWRFDPCWHFERIVKAIDEGPAGTDPEAWQRTIDALAELPAELLRAQRSLGRIPRAFHVESLIAVDELERFLERPLVLAATRADLELESIAELERVQARGLRAVEGFRAWLRTKATISDLEPERLPGGAWKSLAVHALGHEIEIGELRIMLLRQLGDSDKPILADPDDTGGLDRAINAGLAMGLDAGRSTQWIDDETQWAATRNTTYPLSISFGPALSASSSDDRWDITTQPAGEVWPEAAAAARARELSGGHLIAAVLIRVAPGERYLADESFPSELGLERLASTTVGLGAFVGRELELASVRIPGLLVPPVVEGLVAHRRHDVARALAGLELHEERKPLDEVRQRLALWTGWDEWTVERELTALFRDPTRGLNSIRGLELSGLVDDYERLGRARDDVLPRVFAGLQRAPWAPAPLLELLLR